MAEICPHARETLVLDIIAEQRSDSPQLQSHLDNVTDLSFLWTFGNVEKGEKQTFEDHD